MSNKDYEVGYGKPPKKYQFKPGKSGNPKGRPKESKNLSTDISEEMSEMIQLSESGKTKSTSKQRAMIKALCSRALKGNVPAITTLVKLITQAESVRDGQTDMNHLNDEDNAILARYIARLSSPSLTSKGDKS
ncbi:MAG: DUF5681 domain-containing protein [Porticoccus sp.]|uniref:DUF5681 domain-containing protein n=1 Tax=Porticoccus sp. TaxID=2024853 RepID=UPI0032990E89|tara:strand:+ start:15225 stop:15623 length:399 start_codon:yes stop_codon:yes gene_type:complete